MASDFDEKESRRPINVIGLLPANLVFECGRLQPPIKGALEKIIP
jgi:hypothetical protein